MKKIVKYKRLLALVLGLIIGLTVPGFTYATDDHDVQKELDEEIYFLDSLMEFIEDNYLYQVPKDELMEGSLRGLFQNLDQHSSYYNIDEYNNLKESLTGNKVGIGVYVSEGDGYIEIVDVMEDGPSLKAGLKPGDRIVSIDGKEVNGVTLDEAVGLIKGQVNTSVKLGIVREPSSDINYFEITREVISINPVTYKTVEEGIGYIKISQFNENTLVNVTKALVEFDKKKIDKIVFDLRDNPGGSLDEVVNVLKFFVPAGPIVHVKYGDGDIETHNSALSRPPYKLSVLVNGGSASASEIFAGAIQDTQVGKIVGTKTFGKGTVQRLFPLKNGGGIKLTIAEYLTANKNKVDGIGITPDIIVENTIEENFDRNIISYIDKSRKPSLGAVGLDVLGAEEVLYALGYNMNQPDGVLDQVTFDAIKQFQEDKGLHPYGVLDITTQDAILDAAEGALIGKIEDKQLEKAIEILK